MDNHDTFQSQIDEIRTQLSNVETSAQLEGLLSKARILLKQSFQTENEEKARNLFREIREELEKFDSSSVISPKSVKTELETAIPQKTITVSTNTSETNEIELLNNARRLYYAGEYYEAIDTLSAVLRLNPENREAKDRLAQAEDNIKRGVVPDTHVPFEARSAFGRAQSLERADRLDEAKEYYTIALEEARKGGPELSNWQPAVQALQLIDQLMIAQQIRDEADKLACDGNWLEAIERYEAVLRLSPSDIKSKENVTILKQIQVTIENFKTRKENWIDCSVESIEKIVEEFNRLSLMLQCSQRLVDLLREANQLLEQRRNYETLRILNNHILDAEQAIRDGDSCKAVDVLLKVLKNNLSGKKADEIRAEADRLRANAVILCAEKIASEGGYARARAILEFNIENEAARKSLEKLTSRWNRELEARAKQRREYLEELKIRSEIWFKWGVRASVLGAILLLAGALGVFINQIPASTVTAISAILPSVFAKFFIDQYRDLQSQRLTMLSKTSEEERLEIEAQRESLGLPDKSSKNQPS